MALNVEHVARQFRFEGRPSGLEPWEFGHINDTYIAHREGSDGAPQRYILQRINHHVFQDPAGLMRNVEAVTAHLRQKIAAEGGDPSREALTLVPTNDGRTLLTTQDGEYWRAYLFIEGAQTYQTVDNPDHVYSAARAFGRFQQLLADFPAGQLHTTIPDFHHTPKRFEAFVGAVERDVKNRARLVQDEICFITQRETEMSAVVERLERGALPERVTHNDTKLNNVMIDDVTGEGVCVVDLDTVMPGSTLYDFGDAVRSAANSAAEDERDVNKVFMDLHIYERLAHGFLDAARDFLTPAEVQLLPLSARLMTLECGMRFLTDHLNGDVYFRVHRENHNLDRCRTQLKMLDDMERKSEEMARIIARYR
jgi:Ser/Thr protein kinase RdoA (MazF antagonist)